MATRSTLILAICILACAARGRAEACEEYLPIHKILSQPNNVYRFSDDRELKAEAYNVGDCTPYQRYRTGSQFSGNYTLMGQESPINSQACLIKKNSAGDSVYDSMQAVVVRANGWKFDISSLDLDDIDAQTRVPPHRAWKESMAIFGMADGELVVPTTSFYDETLLAAKQYVVPDSAMKEMGFADEAVRIPGAEYAADFVHNCAFGRQNPDSKRCRMTASFDQAIDALAILYAVSQKSRNDPNAAVFFSEAMLKCGCRCSEKEESGPVLTPVEGTENECSVSTSTRPRVKCDLMGNKFCVHYKSISVQRTSQEELPNGNVACAEKESEVVRVRSEFKPSR